MVHFSVCMYVCMYVCPRVYVHAAPIQKYLFQDRSITITTYALCGFANLSSLGTVMGALGAMVPDRKAEISRLALRALVAGTVVSFLNACMAGET